MSIWNHFFDSPYRQRQDIEELRHRTGHRHRRSLKSLSKAKRTIEACEQRIDELQDEIAGLELLCRGLVASLKRAEVLLPGELEAAMQRIDEEDGVIDRKVTREEDRPGDDPNP